MPKIGKKRNSKTLKVKQKAQEGEDKLPENKEKEKDSLEDMVMSLQKQMNSFEDMFADFNNRINFLETTKEVVEEEPEAEEVVEETPEEEVVEGQSQDEEITPPVKKETIEEEITTKPEKEPEVEIEEEEDEEEEEEEAQAGDAPIENPPAGMPPKKTKKALPTSETTAEGEELPTEEGPASGGETPGKRKKAPKPDGTEMEHAPAPAGEEPQLKKLKVEKEYSSRLAKHRLREHAKLKRTSMENLQLKKEVAKLRAKETRSKMKEFAKKKLELIRKGFKEQATKAKTLGELEMALEIANKRGYSARQERYSGSNIPKYVDSRGTKTIEEADKKVKVDLDKRGGVYAAFEKAAKISKKKK